MKLLRRVRRLVFGAPICTKDSQHTFLGKLVALPVFASDAISSVAYASQQILLALGGAGLWILSERERYGSYLLLISLVIVALLSIVVSSYWQTIYAYPSGGGSYIVTKQNLGVTPGLIAGGALLIDYILTVSVSIAAGLQNLANIPIFRSMHFQEHLIAACLIAITLLTVANLRGLKESGAIFSVFTYGFVGLCYLMILLGLIAPFIGWQFDTREIEQVYREFPGGAEGAGMALKGLGLAVFLRAFANGCSAMTGTEAVSNGIPAFAEPKQRNAAMTLVWMALILGSLFLGISFLAMKLHVVYWEHDGKTAPAVIDQISGAIFGKSGPWSLFYLATQLFTAAILLLAANTSFADFPRLSSILARDGFLPRQLSSLGDKLVFDNGILVLGVLAGLLIVAKGGNVDALIPMYAVGVFLAFTLSQTGMVVHWYREKGPHWRRRALINGIGALSTGIVLLDVVFEKFAEGAWIVLIVLAFLFFLFRSIQTHYSHVQEQLAPGRMLPHFSHREHLAIVPISGLHRGIFPALEYAAAIADECRAVYVEIDPSRSERLSQEWAQSFPGIPLVILKSPFRSLLRPISKYMDSLEREQDQRFITLVVPEFVTPSAWQRLLHGNTALLIKLAMANRKHIVVSNVRYHLPRRERATATRSVSPLALSRLKNAV